MRKRQFMSTIIATVRNIPVTQDDNGRVHWQSGTAIDADGANGQNENKFAYRYPTNDGLDDIHGSAGYPNGAWQDILVNDGSSILLRTEMAMRIRRQPTLGPVDQFRPGRLMQPLLRTLS
jgi:hypothetical protein